MRIRGGWIGAIAVAAVMIAAPCAKAQTASAKPDPMQRAYDQARQCYVVNGYVQTKLAGAGDTVNAPIYEAKAKQDYELAYFYAQQLKLSRGEISDDLDTTTNAELPKLTQDSNYLKSAVAFCKLHGLM